MKENTSLRIKVIGHTSSDGDNNMGVSEKRAAAVKDLLFIEFGPDARPPGIRRQGRNTTSSRKKNKRRENVKSPGRIY